CVELTRVDSSPDSPLPYGRDPFATRSNNGHCAGIAKEGTRVRDSLATVTSARIWRRSMILSSAALLTLLSGLCGTANGQTRYHVEVRTADDGLPQNSVNAILQSRDG